MPTAAAPAIPAIPRGALRDFSDRLSPMLVKELRQGLKSPFFVWGLVIMQAALGIGAFVNMGSETDRDSTLAFWWGCTGVICILLPMRVANALRDEMSGNTMDTLVLTRLSAWRITLGKWLATASLQVLMAVTVLPYLIVRYFAGGVNLPQEMACMGLFLLFGIFATTVMLGLSFFRYFLIRSLVMLGMLVGTLMVCTGSIYTLARRGPEYFLSEIRTELGWSGSIAVLLMIGWAGYFFLDLGASQIAPMAENRATRRRLVALVLFISAGAGFWQMTDQSNAVGWTVILGMCCILAGIQAICEVPANYAPVLQPFVKLGPAGRFLGRFVYPGWPSGAVYSTLLIGGAGLFFVIIYFNFMKSIYAPFHGTHYYGMRSFDEEARIMPLLSGILGVIGAVLTPLILWKLLTPKSNWHFGKWLVMLLLPASFHVCLTLVNTKAGSTAVTYAQGLFPTTGLLIEPLAQEQAVMDHRAEEARRTDEYKAAHPNYRSSSTPPSVEAALTGYYHTRRALHRQQLFTVSLICFALWLLAALVIVIRAFRLTSAEESALADELKTSQKPETV